MIAFYAIICDKKCRIIVKWKFLWYESRSDFEKIYILNKSLSYQRNEKFATYMVGKICCDLKNNIIKN